MRTSFTTPASLSPFPGKSRPAARAKSCLPAPAELRAAGFEQVKLLACNIGYLDIRSFQKVEAGAAMTAVVLDFFSDTAALLMDLRRHELGDTAAASLLVSHFFDTELVHLEAEYWTAVRRQRAYSPLGSQGSRYVGPAVYVLIGKRSSTVAIGLARMLQSSGRATIVGEAPANCTISADLTVAEESAILAAHRAALKRLPSVA